MNRYLQLAFIATLCLVVSSCQHKDLCYNHNDHAHRYHVQVVADYRYDWEECLGGPDWLSAWPAHYLPYDSLRPVKPSGLRVVDYSETGESNIHNLSADGGVVTLYAGYNDLLFYNNDTEYIVFTRIDNGATTRASTRSRTRSTYSGSKYANDGEETVNSPDMLYANYFEEYLAEKLLKPAPLEVTLHPLVYTYKIRYEFKEGLEYVALARGALTGMARSVSMNTGHTSEEPATILYDAEMTEFGARAIIQSFGIPDYPHPNYPTRGTNKHALNLEVMLKNGKTINFDFDVTDQVAKQPHGGVIVVKDIVVDKSDGTQGSGAFDVEVNDWGEYEDIYLPL